MSVIRLQNECTTDIRIIFALRRREEDHQGTRYQSSQCVDFHNQQGERYFINSTFNGDISLEITARVEEKQKFALTSRFFREMKLLIRK